MSKKSVFWLVISSILFILTSALITYLENKAVTNSFVDRSTYSHNSYGYKAFVQILQKSSLPITVYKQSFKSLSSLSGTMVVIDPQPFSLSKKPIYISEDDLKDLLIWIKKGNNLVLVDNFTYYASPRLLHLMDISTKSPDTSNQQNRFHSIFTEEDFQFDTFTLAAQKYLNIQDVKAFLMYKVRSIAIKSHARLKNQYIIPILQDEEGVIAAYRRYGKGNVFILTDTSLGDNSWLYNRHYDNYQFMTNILTLFNQPIYVNEYVHGYVDDTQPTHILSQSPLWDLLKQVALIVFIFIMSNIPRFGNPLEYQEKRDKSNVTYIQAMGRVYKKADLKQEVLQTIYNELKSKLTKQCGFLYTLSGDDSLRAFIQNYYEEPHSSKLLSIVEWYEKTITRYKPLKETEMISLVNAINCYLK